TSGAGSLTLSMERTDGPPHLDANIATETDTELTVHAGGMTFVVPKDAGFGLITSVLRHDGTSVLQSGPDSAIDLVAIGDYGQVFRARRDMVYSSDNGPYRAKIVYLGSLCTPADGGKTKLANYMVEAEFDAQRPGPIIRATIRNDDQSVRKNIRFQSLSITGK